MKILIIPIFITLAASLLAGCLEQDLEFTIRYQDVDGLKQGSPLIHGKEVIGSVAEVIYTDRGDFEVKVEVQEPHVSLATDSTLFVIASNPAEQGERVIKLIDDDVRGKPLQDGQTVEGSTALSGIAQEFQNQLGSTLFSFAASIDQSLNQLKEQNIDEHVDNLKNEIDQIINEAKTLSDSANAKLQNDIVPKIKEHIEELKQQLDGLGKDESIDQIEEKMNDLEGVLEA